jgi:hypothetical protein
VTECKSGKVRYRDGIAAMLALAKIRNDEPAGHTEKRAYKCRDCHGWHLTSRP